MFLVCFIPFFIFPHQTRKFDPLLREARKIQHHRTNQTLQERFEATVDRLTRDAKVSLHFVMEVQVFVVMG